MSGKRLFIQGLLFVSMFILGTGVIMLIDHLKIVWLASLLAFLILGLLPPAENNMAKKKK